jgi:hypothetical protein
MQAWRLSKPDAANRWATRSSDAASPYVGAVAPARTEEHCDAHEQVTLRTVKVGAKPATNTDVYGVTRKNSFGRQVVDGRDDHNTRIV